MDESLSYGELEQTAGALARVLVSAYGVGRETPVAVTTPRSLMLVPTLLAVLKAGGCYVPIDPAFPRARAEYMLADSGAELVLAHGGASFAHAVDGRACWGWKS